MVNRCEPVIKTVNENKRKWLLRLSQKASRRGRVVNMSALVAHISSGRQQAPNPTGFAFETWQPHRVPLLLEGDNRPQGRSMTLWVWEVGKSESRAVMVRIRVLTLPDAKAGPRPTKVLHRKRIWRTLFRRRSQMTSFNKYDGCFLRQFAQLGHGSVAQNGTAG